MIAATGALHSVLLIGIEERVLPILQAMLRSTKTTVVTKKDEYEALRLGDGMFSAVFCGSAITQLSGVAIGRELHKACPRTPKYFVTLDTASFQARLLLENGFDEAFLLPIDKADLKKTVEEKINDDNGHRTFVPMKALEIDVGTRLDFDTFVFLPLNDKYVKFTFAGQEFDTSKLQKLQERELNKLFIDKREVEKFYRYVARRLRDPGADGNLDREERARRLRSAVRSIFADIFDPAIQSDPEAGKAVLDICRNVISNYITHGADSDWYQRLLDALGEVGDTYSHSMNVSTYAALFAIGMENEHVKDLAMAGLLHDIGMITLPEAITEKPPQKMTPEERNLYSMHAEKSISLLKSKNVVLPESVATAIAQHHETWNGQGYPKKLVGAQISREAQLLSFADQFDYFTRFENGYGLGTKEAFDEVRRTLSIDPALLDLILPLLDGSSPRAKKTA